MGTLAIHFAAWRTVKHTRICQRLRKSRMVTNFLDLWKEQDMGDVFFKKTFSFLIDLREREGGGGEERERTSMRENMGNVFVFLRLLR